MKNIKTKFIKELKELPEELRESLADKLVEDILMRYDSEEYWDDDIIHAFLQDNGYQLGDGPEEKTLNFKCNDCKTEANWTASEIVEKGTPICPKCDNDMVAGDN